MGVVLRLVGAFLGRLGCLERLVGEFSHGQSVGQLESGLEAVGQAGANVGLDHDAVHHHVDVVLELLVQRRNAVDLVELAVHLDPGEPLLLEFGKLLAVLALAAAHDGRHQVKPRSLRQRQHAVDHLRDGLALDGKPRCG